LAHKKRIDPYKNPTTFNQVNQNSQNLFMSI
jgi:hypothetical protein